MNFKAVVGFGKFFVVSVVSTLCDWLVFALLISYVNYLVAVSCSYFVGGFVGFFGNRGWTFRVKDSTAKRFFVWYLVAGSSLLVTLGLMYFFVDVNGFGKLFSRVVVTGLVFFINFFAHKFITFSRRV